MLDLSTVKILGLLLPIMFICQLVMLTATNSLVPSGRTNEINDPEKYPGRSVHRNRGEIYLINLNNFANLY